MLSATQQIRPSCTSGEFCVFLEPRGGDFLVGLTSGVGPVPGVLRPLQPARNASRRTAFGPPRARTSTLWRFRR